MNKYKEQRGDALVELEIVAERLNWRLCKVIDEVVARTGTELSQIGDDKLLEALKTIKEA